MRKITPDSVMSVVTILMFLVVAAVICSGGVWALVNIWKEILR